MKREREAVAEVCRRLVAERLVVGTAGNVSVRVGDQVAVTPSGVGYQQLSADMVGVHDLDGAPVDAPLKPTSELPMHLAVYRATGAAAIVHTHSVAATALSCLVTEVPRVHYYLAIFGGVVRVADYAPYGTAALARTVVDALTGSAGCLMANHGALVVGDDLDQAFERAQYLEWLCELSLRVLSAGIPPKLLSTTDIADVVTRLSTYGQR